MTAVQRLALEELRDASRRVVLARVGVQRRSRFSGEPTPLGEAIRHRNMTIVQALNTGVSPQLVGETAGIACPERVRKIAGATS